MSASRDWKRTTSIDHVRATAVERFYSNINKTAEPFRVPGVESAEAYLRVAKKAALAEKVEGTLGSSSAHDILDKINVENFRNRKL